MAKAGEEVTLEIERRGGEKLRVTIPAEWKITYGPVIGEQRHGGESGNVLRIYESKEKQRALFTKVEAFRDLSIPCQKLVTKRVENAESQHGPKGSKSKANAEITQEWETVPF